MKLPLKHLKKLTDQNGMIQHCKWSKPDLNHGYSIDDNARALIICNSLFAENRDPLFLEMANIYLEYISKARENQYFHNFMDRSGRFIDDKGSDDSFGRTIWAIGSVIQMNLDPKLTKKAESIYNQTRATYKELKHLRSVSFALIGLINLKELILAKSFADFLVSKYLKNKEDGWKWFEETMTYSNAIIPLSLLNAYQVLHDDKYFNIGVESLEYLDSVCRIAGLPAPIGQKHWHRKGGSKSVFDQQLIDVADMVMAYVAAYKISKNIYFYQKANNWFSWFHGHNILGLSLVDMNSEGCFDALRENGVNRNQGAESILAYLLSCLSISDKLFVKS